MNNFHESQAYKRMLLLTCWDSRKTVENQASFTIKWIFF